MCRVALSMGFAILFLFLFALFAFAFENTARADIDVRALARAFADSSGAVPSNLRVLGRSSLPAIVELPSGEDPSASGVGRISSHFGVVRAPLSELARLATAHPAWRMTWSAPFRPLLDRATAWAGVPSFRNDTRFTGKGVYVGIVDTGVDVLHHDLRNADGTTRIAYLIDFGSAPAPDGDTDAQNKSTLPCSVYTAAMINRMLANGQARSVLSHDTVGHGTHVASLAAGNGGSAEKFVGMAPEASLVIARVLDASNEIDDATILAATKLIFSLAGQVPAVVNLSLGSDFGPHDGTAPLERSLSDLVGPDHPGRAIVVAAGNSAELFQGPSGYPSPVGIHTEVNVPESASAIVPIVTRTARAGDTVSSTLFVWLAYRPGDDLRVGIDRNGKEWVSPKPVGSAATYFGDEPVQATLVNGALGQIPELGFSNANAAAVIIDGTWPRTDRFALRLEGPGTANLWIQATGDLSLESGGAALFPGALMESTITIPASHPGLIAVGATVNRTTWTDVAGDAISVTGFGAVNDSLLDSVAFFSSAGPTTDSRIKPDLVAPGAFVVGAMSRDANPATNKASIFADSAFCDPADHCAVVDSDHAVTAGTSMAAPLVAGAIALLFEGDPTLSEDQLLTLLQAGARYPRGGTPLGAQLGAGALYLPGILDVQHAMATKVQREPAAGASWLTMGQAYAHPDPAWSIPVILQLRDSSGLAADGFEASDLDVDVDHGTLTSPLEREAPGLYRFSVAANENTGGDFLEVDVRYKQRTLVMSSEPIAVDVNVIAEGFVAHGGCSVTLGFASRTDAAWLLACTFIVWRGRRYNRAARRGRNRDRRDS